MHIWSCCNLTTTMRRHCRRKRTSARCSRWSPCQRRSARPDAVAMLHKNLRDCVDLMGVGSSAWRAPTRSQFAGSSCLSLFWRWTLSNMRRWRTRNSSPRVAGPAGHGRGGHGGGRARGVGRQGPRRCQVLCHICSLLQLAATMLFVLCHDGCDFVRARASVFKYGGAVVAFS